MIGLQRAIAVGSRYEAFSLSRLDITHVPQASEFAESIFSLVFLLMKAQVHFRR